MKNSELLIQGLCQQGFYLIDELLPSDDYHSLCTLAQQFYEHGLFRSAKIGLNLTSQQNNTIRADKIFWIEGNEEHPALQLFLNKIKSLAHLFNQHLFLSINEFETHFANYQPGTYYKKHIDQFASQKTRKVSFVYYLNPDWQENHGGELHLYDQEDRLVQTVAPKGNRFICFNSELPHEVCITHQPRYSITGWMKTRALSIG